MRCPTCGTENTPDSRFCGGCGAKLEVTTSRVAPTAKIPDDAPFPQSIPPNSYVAPNYSSGPASIPPPANAPYQTPPPYTPQPSYHTPPPTSYHTPPPSGPTSYVPPSDPGRPASVPPGASRANPARPQLAEPSMSMPAVPPPRRVGLIILVLLLDIGLATAGAVMLGKGLAKPERSTTPPSKIDPSPVQVGSGSATPATPPAPAKTGSAIPAGGGSALADLVAQAEDPKVASNVASATTTTTTTKQPPHDKKQVKTVTPPPPKPDAGVGVPQDPYDPARLTSEIELQATRGREAFDRCYIDAGGAGVIHGSISIAFQVLTDGRVSNVNAVENSTGSTPLASCLIAVFARWTFASHPANPANFVRPFNYP